MWVGQPGGDADGILGHEQQHVKSRIWRVRKFVVDPLEKEKGGEFKTTTSDGNSEPPNSCTKLASDYQEDYQRLLENHLDPGLWGDHADDEKVPPRFKNPDMPIEGKPYPIAE